MKIIKNQNNINFNNNISVSRYDDKKNKKYLDDSAQCELNKKQKKAKKEIYVYELEFINQVLYNKEDS